jgi:hypothetical protein
LTVPGVSLTLPAPDLIAVSVAIATETAIKSPARSYIPGISGSPARMSGQRTTRKASGSGKTDLFADEPYLRVTTRNHGRAASAEGI